MMLHQAEEKISSSHDYGMVLAHTKQTGQRFPGHSEKQ